MPTRATGLDKNRCTVHFPFTLYGLLYACFRPEIRRQAEVRRLQGLGQVSQSSIIFEPCDSRIWNKNDINYVAGGQYSNVSLHIWKLCLVPHRKPCLIKNLINNTNHIKMQIFYILTMFTDFASIFSVYLWQICYTSMAFWYSEDRDYRFL
jgi:hypothetical protein